jgi:phospholipase C
VADPIKHVVVLMMENRSFDHMLGCMQSKYPDLDGIPAAGPPRSNADKTGIVYPQAPGAARQIANDPDHEYTGVVTQMDGGAMSGFVLDYQTHFPNATAAELAEVMKYHAYGSLPALHALAENFTICDHWFHRCRGRPGRTACSFTAGPRSAK